MQLFQTYSVLGCFEVGYGWLVNDPTNARKRKVDKDVMWLSCYLYFRFDWLCVILLSYCGYGLLVMYYTGGGHVEWWAMGIVQSTPLTWNWKNLMTSKYMIATYQYHDIWNKCQGLGMMLETQETLVELANWWMTINCFSLGCTIEDLAWLEKCFNWFTSKGETSTWQGIQMYPSCLD